MSKRRRTESPNAVFEQGYAQGWRFGVPEAFRACLDISLDLRADKAANEALAASLGRKPDASERIVRPVWTQGSPPAYAFGRGNMLHEPAHAHTLPWAEALPILSRSIVVLDARADDEAAPETVDDPCDQANDDACKCDRDGGAARGGWVEFELYHYDNGQIRHKENRRMSQAGFVQLLQFG